MIDAAREDLLRRVSDRLSGTPSTTDHLMLARWRLLSTCQYLLGGPDKKLEDASVAALEVFANQGAGPATDKALEAVAALVRSTPTPARTVLPRLGVSKRLAVAQRLAQFAAEGPAVVTRAIHVAPRVRERIEATAMALSTPGIRYRFELIARALADEMLLEQHRVRAAAAVLYVDNISDVIPDTLSAIGMLDDDYALRIALSDIDGGPLESHLHWSEKIASLWDDLPFLQGINLRRGGAPNVVTWLDRANSYVSYTHVLAAEKAPLVLLQPSVACSPLHVIVSLVGLLVLDALTSARGKARGLQSGQTYELDDCIVVFEGVGGGPNPDWLRLRLRGCFAYAPPDAVDRLIPVDHGRLSTQRDFLARPQGGFNPLQRFLGWNSGIAPTSISGRVVLVTSRQSALYLLENVESNGVCLLDHGLVRFISAAREAIDTYGAVVLVTPSLAEARQLLDKDVQIQTILVDGYDRLHRGRHDLPFLMNRRNAPSIIIWSATGYYPSSPPVWLPEHQTLEVSPTDLASILELDATSSDPATLSLWEAATGARPYLYEVLVPPHEQRILDEIDTYVRRVRSAAQLPDYWKYHLTTLARSLRSLIAATPAAWSEIRQHADSSSASLDEKWSLLRASAIDALSDIKAAEVGIHAMIAEVPEEWNSRAAGLRSFLSETHFRDPPGHWFFVCANQAQLMAVTSLALHPEFKCVTPILLRDLEVCSPCLTAGWLSRLLKKS